MAWLKTIWKALVELCRILLYGWLLALVRILKEWIALLEQWRAARKIPERERKTAVSPCVPIREPAFVHPDPMIYSQYYLLQLGFAVTWDNPDIQLFKGGVPVPSELLERNTEYEIVARVWNNSTEAPIQSLPVRFFVMSFGIGMRQDLIGLTAINLGVKGGPNHPAFAHMKWRTPDVDGHYCLQVFLDWLDDTNPFNNLGQENTNVGTVHSPAVFDFNLRNDTANRQKYRLEADSYAIPDAPPCGDERRSNPQGLHNRANYPIPEGWTVTINPDQLEIEAAGQRAIQVSVEVPSSFHGRAPVNVHAFFGNEKLAGGVTLYVERS